jgi:hypothetical protein
MTCCISLGIANFTLYPIANCSRITLHSLISTMATSRILARSSRAVFTLPRSTYRSFSLSTARSNEFDALNKRTNDTSETYRRYQIEKPLNPHLTNTTSTITNEMPAVGRDAAPPELVTNVDPKFTPKDSVPENTERMTGGTQNAKKVSEANKEVGELGVGEMEGAKFKVEPIRRTGEDSNTMRARLLCPFHALAHAQFLLSFFFTLFKSHVHMLTTTQTKAGKGEP